MPLSRLCTGHNATVSRTCLLFSYVVVVACVSAALSSALVELSEFRSQRGSISGDSR